MAALSKTFIKHLWLDADDTSRLVPPAVLARLASRVTSSEQRHSGQIRICIEASLPLSYLWRVGLERSLQQVTRERALMMFGKLGVWDTAHNNGVLIYVLLAEHAIEIVADRGLADHTSNAHWTELVAHMRDAFRVNSYEDGLIRAVEEVSVELERSFPLPVVDSAVGGLPANGRHPNELPDTPRLF
ncbi:MAG: TPM domain-containing protein [Polaromonas sp.]|nr:TPM domain-containing protein [Polaromonas sp.]